MMMRCTALVLLVLTVVSCVPPTDTRMVTLVADGKSRETATEALTVRDLLTEAEIELDAEDRVTPTEPTLLQHGMTIRVIRVETRAETEQREIPFDRRTVRETSIPEGESQLLEPGVTGIEELIYRITLEDGDEVDRRLVRRVTLREPRTEIILVGAQKEQNPIPITGTIAYVAHHNAWVIRRTSPNHRRLTHDGDLDGRVFALSADGSHLAFTRVPTETEESAPVNTLWILDTSAVDAKPVRLEVESVLWADWEPGCDVGHTASGCRIAYTTGARAEGNPGWRANN
ncbi:MAG: G5 domain-containing protein, partial [Anaerolineae bacterium]